MIELSAVLNPSAKSPAASAERPIDLVHLSRMTLGDRSLEREVLALFDRQAAMLIARMREVAPNAVSAVAHTLKGSARGIGAWRVAHAAETVELATPAGESDVRVALADLSAAIDEVHGVIAELLRAH